MKVGGHGGVANDGLGINGGNGGGGNPEGNKSFEGAVNVSIGEGPHGNRYSSNWEVDGYDENTDINELLHALRQQITENSAALGLPQNVPLTRSEVQVYNNLDIALQIAVQDLAKEGGGVKTINLKVGSNLGTPIFSAITLKLNN